MGHSTATVLVVDDELIDSTVMRRALEMVGHVVFEADSYDTALQAFDAHEDVELVVADVSLPSKDGIELARALLRKKPTLKFLFTSGWIGSEIMRSSGIPELDRYFLAKPFRPDDLIAAVRRILDSSESFSIPDVAGDAASSGA
jgi:CheY-like chemotaxis protein